MVDKLSITIALEGGKQIEQQLAGIGAAGQKAFLDIAKAAEQAGGFKNLKPEEVTAKLKEMGIVGTDAFNKIQNAVAGAARMERIVGVVQTVEQGFAGLTAAAVGFARALGPIGAAAVGVGTALVKGVTAASEAIHKADTEAIKLGLSIEKFSQLKQGFEQTGASAGAIGDGIKHANEAIDKLKLDRVALLFKVADEAAKRGDSATIQFTRSVTALKEAAEGVGPAADAARAALVNLGAVKVSPELDRLAKQLGITAADLPKSEEMFRRLGIAVGDVATVIPQFVEKMRQLPDSAQRSADAIALLGPKLGVEFIQALRTGGVAVDQFRERLTNLTQNQANTANALEQSFNKLDSTYTNLKTTLFAKLGELGLTSALETLNKMLNESTWESWEAAALSALNTLLTPVDLLISAFERLWEKIKAVGSAIGAIAAGGGTPGSVTPIPGNAAGGYIRGPGTATSDSILSRLSNGEYVLSAKAVRHWGVGFLNSLNGLRTMPTMPRFAEGGLVGGGMAHLGTVDLSTNNGMVRVMVNNDSLAQLKKAAVARGIGGTRKPGWVG